MHNLKKKNNQQFPQQQSAGSHLYAQAAGLALLVHGALPAGPAEHVGAHFALAVHLLKERRTSPLGFIFFTG